MWFICKWGFVLAENDDTQFRDQALENKAQKLAILKLTACHLKSAYSATLPGFILQFL